MDKNTARKRGLSARASISDDTRRRYDASLLKQMKELAESAELIGCYVSMNDEADTSEFLEWCFAKGKQVAVPLVEGSTLTFHRITSFAELHPGGFGVREPSGDDPVDLDCIDLMFVPLSSFDKYGNRTGYGKGFYDSVLLPSMRKIGIAYPEQEMDRIEPDPWDVPLDAVIIPIMDE